MSDMIYRPLIEEMTWSYSRIECFHDCPYRWFLKYIREESEKPMFYSSYGSFMHKLLEDFYKGEISQKEMYIKFLFDFSSNVQGDRPSEKIVENYIHEGEKFIKSFSPLPFKPIAIEKWFSFDIRGKQFQGFVDYIGELDGEIFVVDHKSRKLKKRSNRNPPTAKDEELDEMLKQLYLYSAAVEQEYGKLPSYLCFNCFRNGELVIEPFNKETYENTVDWAIRSVEEIEQSEDFYPSVEYFKCNNICGMCDICCYKY